MKAKHMLTGRGLRWLLQQVRGGSFKIVYTDGTTEYYGDGEPQFTVPLRDDEIFKLWSGDLSMSFGEAFPPVSGKRRLKCMRFLFPAVTRATYRSHAKLSTRRNSNNKYQLQHATAQWN